MLLAQSTSHSRHTVPSSPGRGGPVSAGRPPLRWLAVAAPDASMAHERRRRRHTSDGRVGRPSSSPRTRAPSDSALPAAAVRRPSGSANAHSVQPAPGPGHFAGRLTGQGEVCSSRRMATVTTPRIPVVTRRRTGRWLRTRSSQPGPWNPRAAHHGQIRRQHAGADCRLVSGRAPAARAGRSRRRRQRRRCRVRGAGSPGSRSGQPPEIRDNIRDFPDARRPARRHRVRQDRAKRA